MVPAPLGVVHGARAIVVAALLVLLSRHVVSLRPSHPLGSVLVGLIVFVIWVGPDAWFPGYRQHWLFQNSITGEVRSTVPAELKASAAFIGLRLASSIMLVPVLEELFWRGWLMRWLVHPDFLKVPLGTYTAYSFWLVAVLFASEHGPYWDVGLLAGAVYNWWLIRTRNLANCILAHAVTNGFLAVYVLAMDQWQYWL
jgi:hypothetical protein